MSVPKIEINLVLMVCLFLLLEGALASVFGRILIFMREMGEGFSQIILCVIALLSAWVTGFNCFWMFSPYSESYNSAPIFAFTLVIGWLISVYFLHYHSKQRQESKILSGSIDEGGGVIREYQYHYWIAFTVNLVAFVFVFFYLVEKFMEHVKVAA